MKAGNSLGTRHDAPAHLPEVEALRCLAISLVFLFHADSIIRGLAIGQDDRQIVSIPLAFVLAGSTGVRLFFVLSGFLLSLPFLREARAGTQVDRRRYFARRALRILPLYWTLVLWATLFMAWFEGWAPALRAGTAHAVFLDSVGLGSTMWPYSIVWWSLATEVQFYLLLPGIGWLLAPRRGVILWLSAAIYAVAYAAYLAGALRFRSVTAQLLLDQSVFGQSIAFLAGIAAAATYRNSGERIRTALARSPLWTRGGADLLALGILLGLGRLLQWVVATGGWVAGNRPAWRLLEAFLWATFLIAVLLTPMRCKALLSNRATRRIGEISYSIYLLHVPIFTLGLGALAGAGVVLDRRWSPAALITTAGLAVAVYIASEATYRFIERPYLARKARLAP